MAELLYLLISFTEIVCNRNCLFVMFQEELKEHNCEAGTSQVTPKSQRHMPWKDDIFSLVQGPAKKGRLRCMGKMPKAKKSKVEVSENQDNQELRNRVKRMENLFLNVMTLIENRFPGEDVNDILETVRQVYYILLLEILLIM